VRTVFQQPDRAAAKAQLKTVCATLAHLRERHGGAAAYLLAAGLTPADLDALRARLLN
jgi:hypothetical protein